MKRGTPDKNVLSALESSVVRILRQVAPNSMSVGEIVEQLYQPHNEPDFAVSCVRILVRRLRNKDVAIRTRHGFGYYIEGEDETASPMNFLTKSETEVVEILHGKTRPLTKSDIIDRLWGEMDEPKCAVNVVDVLIHNIRTKGFNIIYKRPGGYWLGEVPA